MKPDAPLGTGQLAHRGHDRELHLVRLATCWERRQFKCDFNDYFSGARNLEFTRSINPELQTFDQWLAQHKDQIPLPAEV